MDFSINDIAQQYRKYIPAFYDTPVIDTMPDEAVDGVKYYRSSGTEVNGSYNAFYQYDYKFNQYKNATSLKNAFRSSQVQYDSYEKQMLVTTEASGMLLFKNNPQLSQVKINVTTTYNVMEHNADYVNGNTYTWVFTKDTKKGVYLLMEDREGKSVGGITNNEGETQKDPEKGDENQEGNKGNNSSNNDKTKEDGKTPLEKGYDKVKEKGEKHPYLVIIICISVFVIFILFTFRIKKA